MTQFLNFRWRDSENQQFLKILIVPKTGSVSPVALTYPLHRWRLNLDNNTLYILSLKFMSQDRGIFA